MNKWLYRAAGTIGIAGGVLVFGAASAHADDTESLGSPLEDAFSPTSGLPLLDLTGADREPLDTSGLLLDPADGRSAAAAAGQPELRPEGDPITDLLGGLLGGTPAGGDALGGVLGGASPLGGPGTAGEPTASASLGNGMPVGGAALSNGLPVAGASLGNGLPAVGGLSGGGLPVPGALAGGLPLPGNLAGGLPVTGNLAGGLPVTGGLPLAGELAGGLPVAGELASGVPGVAPADQEQLPPVIADRLAAEGGFSPELFGPAAGNEEIASTLPVVGPALGSFTRMVGVGGLAGPSPLIGPLAGSALDSLPVAAAPTRSPAAPGPAAIPGERPIAGEDPEFAAGRG